MFGLVEHLQATTQFTPAATHEHMFVHLLLIHVQYGFPVSKEGALVLASIMQAPECGATDCHTHQSLEGSTYSYISHW